MKNYKKISLITAAFAISSVLFLVVSKQATTKQKLGSESFMVNLSKSLPKGVRLVEVKKDEPPALFQFVFESDYVVIGSAVDLRVVGKRDKKPIGSKEFDMNEWGAGAVDSISVESILFSKKAFEENVIPVPIHTLEIFKEDFRTLDGGSYVKGGRYLLFLKAISKDDRVFTKLELDKNQTYYQTFFGDQSLFPHSRPSMEGPSKRGEIDLSTDWHSKLVENIQRFCEALSPGDNDTKIRNLRKLAKSDDQILRENAEYAIKFLSQKQGESGRR